MWTWTWGLWTAPPKTVGIEELHLSPMREAEKSQGWLNLYPRPKVVFSAGLAGSGDSSIVITTLSRFSHTLIFLNFLLDFGEYSINNVEIVSGSQQRASALYIHVSILPQTPLPSRLPWALSRAPCSATELHSRSCPLLCYTVGPCWLATLNIAVCICWSQIP